MVRALTVIGYGWGSGWEWGSGSGYRYGSGNSRRQLLRLTQSLCPIASEFWLGFEEVRIEA
jgi:hypothetical protein